MASQDTPPTLHFTTLDVFTTTPFLGNPLAVVFVPPSARPHLTQSAKQRIAREFNLSETVFLHTLPGDDDPAHPSSPEKNTREIDIFTIEEELPFAGHPTIGTAYLVLKTLGWRHVTTLLTKAGPIHIQLDDTAGTVRAAIPSAVHIHQQTLGGLLTSASTAEVKATVESGLSKDATIRAAELTAPIVSVVRGMTFVLVRLPGLADLARIETGNRIDFAPLVAAKGLLLDVGEWGVGFVSRYYYVPTSGPGSGTEGGRTALQTRMVELGFEDPATGSAASTLASWLTISEGREKGCGFDITQGVEMGRKSDIVVDTVAGRDGGSGELVVKELYLGGSAVVVMNGVISV